MGGCYTSEGTYNTEDNLETILYLKGQQIDIQDNE